MADRDEAAAPPHRPARYHSLLATWLRGWLTPPRRAVAEPLPEIRHGEVGVTYAGHATVLIRYANLTIACDPMLGLRLGAVRRATQPGLSPAELRDVDLILLSHTHPGHLHLPTLRRLPRAATVVLPPRCADTVSALGFARVVELGHGVSVQHRRVDITSTPVRHAAGRRAAAAYVIRGDGPSVFFCGDSGYYSGFAEVGRRFHPSIAVLPIGGYLPSSFRDRHMTPADALAAFGDLRARMLVPIHWGAFPLSYERLDDPVRWLRRLVTDRQLEAFVSILEAGASARFTRPAEPEPEPQPAAP